MIDADYTTSNLRDMRDMDVFAEFRNFQAKWEGSSADGDPSTESICRTILFATDVLRRTILAVHDAQQACREYNP